KKAVYTPPPGKSGPQPSPQWWAPVMVGLMLAGLAYVVFTYLVFPPIRSLGQWNLAIGFGGVLAGFLMTMRWR
ncbi:MAG: cell division protein CrgA, partial [Bifidobacteriaceae bacterium]|nr:cell division protein CrgA [Bifidobacteriaceae bacterium]